MNKIQKRVLYSLLSIAFFFGSTTWLLAPFFNHFLERGPNLISEYESLGMAHADLYRFFDLIGAVSLLIAVYLRRKNIKTHYNRAVVGILYFISGLLIFDAFVPLSCRLQQLKCMPEVTAATYLHLAESYSLSLLVLGLSIYAAIKFKKIRWLPLALVVCWLLAFIIKDNYDGLLFGIQVTYSLLQIYLLWFVTLSTAFDTPLTNITKSILKRGLAIAMVLNAFLTILIATLHLSTSERIKGFVFTQNTAWLSQHTFLAAIALLILARAIRQGSINAWRAVTVLSFLEVINYSSIAPDIEPLIIFFALFVTLLMSRKAFDKQHSAVRLLTRAKRLFVVVFVTIISVAAFSALYQWHYTGVLTKNSFPASRVVVRTLLIEVSSDPHDTIRAKLFGQVLTATGIFLYGWLFMGLFLPSFLPSKLYTQEEELEEIADLLKRHSTNSEDHFKVWPPDKNYWFTENREVAIAYKQSGAYTFALADPIAAKTNIQSSLKAFHSFCRAHGSTICWLMIGHDSLKYYKKQGLRYFGMGASAIVNVEKFSTETVKNKWWRWARNKSIKQGLSYQTLLAPQSEDILNTLQAISNRWLEQNKHKEHTFALGYFDKQELKNCTIHTLVNQNNEIIAYANQVPTYGQSKQVTIDLMRYEAGHEGVMAHLLSEVILQIGQEGYSLFDLGFVPLAHLGNQKTTKALFKLSKKALKPVFSMQGLEQFKNKFDPEWEQNYIAWDGDMLDLPIITTTLQKILTK